MSYKSDMAWSRNKRRGLLPVRAARKSLHLEFAISSHSKSSMKWIPVAKTSHFVMNKATAFRSLLNPNPYFMIPSQTQLNHCMMNRNSGLSRKRVGSKTGIVQPSLVRGSRRISRLTLPGNLKVRLASTATSTVPIGVAVDWSQKTATGCLARQVPPFLVNVKG